MEEGGIEAAERQGSRVDETTENRKPIVLKDPFLAAFLAWLVPGLGHLYQGRTGKAVLFFVCLMGTFAYGCYLGGSRELGFGRVVYFAWQGDDTRLPFLCQLGMGLPTMPAWIQAYRVSHGKGALWNGFMAPPKPGVGNDGDGPPTLDKLNYELSSYFELGTVYTMIAGLLNVLAIYDAWGGPVFPEEAKKEDEDEAKGKKDEGGKRDPGGEKK